MSTQDMSSLWKTTGLGGGGRTRLPCFACMVFRDNISVFKTGAERCDVCERLACTQCFCHPVNDRNYLVDQEAILWEYAEVAMDYGYEKIDYITKNSQLLFDCHQVDRDTNIRHIDFKPKDSFEHQAFKRFLKDELKLRLQDSDNSTLESILEGGIEERREALRSLVADEVKITEARKTVDRHYGVQTVYNKLRVENACVCVLHMEMRLNEKLFYTLLGQGMDRYLQDSKTRRLFVLEVQNYMQTHGTGGPNTGRLSQWQFPLEKDNQVGTPSLSGEQSRQCVLAMKGLAAVIFSEELDESPTNIATGWDTIRMKNKQLHQQWEAVIESYLSMMQLIKVKEDLTEEQIDQVHIQAMELLSNWVKLPGCPSITNYMHFCCHLHYYLTKYRNLYKYSQQGWEAMNQKLKHFYFNNTNHGGCAGGRDGGIITNDHLRPLMRMCQRFVMWRMGFGERFFSHVQNDWPDVDDEWTDLEAGSNHRNEI